MNEFKEYHSKLADEDLIRIAYFETKKFKKDARISAKEIIKERNLSKKSVEVIKKKFRKKIRRERIQKLKDKSDDYSIFNFIVDILLGS